MNYEYNTIWNSNTIASGCNKDFGGKIRFFMSNVEWRWLVGKSFYERIFSLFLQTLNAFWLYQQGVFRLFKYFSIGTPCTDIGKRHSFDVWFAFTLECITTNWYWKSNFKSISFFSRKVFANKYIHTTKPWFSLVSSITKRWSLCPIH